jgi:hypothetical protein
MTRKNGKSASNPRPIQGIPLEIQKRIRIFAAARNLNNIDFFEQYLGKIMENLDAGTQEKGQALQNISESADIVMGGKIYPFASSPGGLDRWSIRIRDSFSETVFKFAHLTTGSIESFIREVIIQIGQRLPPSDHIIRGYNRRMERKDNGRAEVVEQNWDGRVDVAPDETEGDREF